MSTINASLPKGSWVLITGVNGFIASHTALEFLTRGYKVRGTVRSISKTQWLTKELFTSYATSGAFEVISVPDMAADNAFDEAMKGMSAVAHIATIQTWDPNPHNVIPQTIAGALNVLKAAKKESSVKQVVYTTSSVASFMPDPSTEFNVDANSWNDMAVQMAWSPPPYGPERGPLTYIASKVEAEKAVWKFAEEEKPAFVVNVVSPFTAFGKILNENQKTSTQEWVLSLYRGETDMIQNFKALIYINVRDAAIMHMAAILDPDVKHQRIFAWNKPFNWNLILAMMRKLRPEHKFVDDFPDTGMLSGKVDDRLALKLLKKWAGQDGWTSLEEGIKENLEGVE